LQQKAQVGTSLKRVTFNVYSFCTEIADQSKLNLSTDQLINKTGYKGRTSTLGYGCSFIYMNINSSIVNEVEHFLYFAKLFKIII